MLVAAIMMTLVAGDLQAQRGEPPADARFVASSRGQVFYWIGCESWKRLSEANRIFFRTASDAEAAGYRPSTAHGCAPQLDTALIVPRVGGRAVCTVSRIIDGDTFQCEGGSRVRLLLVDADEIGQSALADSATALLERLMPVGNRVQLEFDVQLSDQYDRILAHVMSDDVLINRELVRQGLAHITIYPPNVRHVEELRAAADSARSEKRGIWRAGAFACTPAAFRAGRCR